MPVLPFHRYIGPGNKTDNGEPVDEDDRIARQHDIKYDLAKTEEDIRKADLEAILLFRKNWHDGNWHSLIGDVGLSLKYAIESFTGVIYPDLGEIKFVEKCDLIIIGNILRLYCPFKNRPLIEKFMLPPFSQKNRSPVLFSHESISNSEQSYLLPFFLYLPLNWTEVYFQIKYTNTKVNEYPYNKILNLPFGKFNTNNYNKGLNSCERYIIWNYLLNKLKLNGGIRNEKPTDNDNPKKLIHFSNIFIDQDWNLYLDKM